MKYTCKWCNCEIEIPQSEKAKKGLTRLHDHEVECFKKRTPNFGNIINRASAMSDPLPEELDMVGIIKYLNKQLGKIPNEDQCLRFAMFLDTNPTPKDGEDFCKLLRGV